MSPSLAGFTTFVQSSMGIPVAALPSTSPDIAFNYNLALEIVNMNMAAASSTVYTLAVYNLAGDYLINFASDQLGQSFFTDIRASFGINSFVPGVISESHDATTGQALLNPDFMRELSMSNLQNLKTPYGRQYLAFAQMMGPTVWGLI
jgi:hypothetical protein